MSIDECLEYAEDINATVTFPKDCKKDERFFEYVVEYLEELKELREKWSQLSKLLKLY